MLLPALLAEVIPKIYLKTAVWPGKETQMTEKHCCVINAEKRYITYVLVLVDQGVETVQNYTLHEGEQLIDATPPVMRTSTAPDGYIVPVWDGTAWAEGATEEEVAAWSELHPDWLEADGIAYIRYKLVSIIRDEEGQEISREEGAAVTLTAMAVQFDSSLALAQAEAWPGSITVERVPEDERPQTPPPTNDELAEENKRLKAQMEMQAQNITFLENCLLEMGDIVYA